MPAVPPQTTAQSRTERVFDACQVWESRRVKAGNSQIPTAWGGTYDRPRWRFMPLVLAAVALCVSLAVGAALVASAARQGPRCSYMQDSSGTYLVCD